MSENKYNRVTCKVDGVEVDRSKVVFVPKPNSDGVFKTSDGSPEGLLWFESTWLS